MLRSEYSSMSAVTSPRSPNSENSLRRVAISSSLARRVTRRAAMLSSAAQTVIISRISSLVLRTMNTPLRGTILTRPSCSSRASASRIGVRLIASFSDSARSSRRSTVSSA